MRELTAERLRYLFHYEPSSGIFTVLINSKGRKKGAPVGYISDQGYRKISVDNHEYRAHRLAWLYVYGEWPKQFIDHLNHVRDDNRIRNLRDVSNSANLYNRSGPTKQNALGVLGVAVAKDKSGRKFIARAWINGKSVHLGTHLTLADAMKVRARKMKESGLVPI